MTVASRKGNAGKADLLAARIVRSRGRCQYPDCNRTDVVWAHVIRRRYSATRCLEDGAWALCGTHHDLVDNWPDEHAKVVAATIGEERYLELKRIANEGHPLSATLFWASEVERLEARCRELEIDTRRKIPA